MLHLWASKSSLLMPYVKNRINGSFCFRTICVLPMHSTTHRHDGVYHKVAMLRLYIFHIWGTRSSQGTVTNDCLMGLWMLQRHRHQVLR